jgi:predicted RND superfamily exporter protein
MEDEIIDGSVTEPGVTKPGEAPSAPEGGVEQQVPLSRLREEIQKRKEVEAKLQALPQAGQPDKKTEVRQLLEQIEADKQREEREAKEKFNNELAELKKIDPSLDDDAFQNIVTKYGFASTDKAFQFYQDLKKGQTPAIKPKLPVAPQTGDKVIEEEFDTSKAKNAYEAVKIGLKKFGL